MTDEWLSESTPTTPVQIISGNALETLLRSEIDIQISTARSYPRGNLAVIKARIRELALLDAETAEACVYRLPARKGSEDNKPIEGPSVRLAEIVTSCWGNVRQASRVIEIGEKSLVAQGICHDLETNVAVCKEARRGITTKNGARYGNDMINVTANAACSIALRNAIFTVVPFALIKPIVEECKRFAVEEEARLQQESARQKSEPGLRRPDTRRQALAAFVKVGATEAEVYKLLGVAGVDQMTPEHVVNLRTLYQAIRDGAVTMDEAMQRETSSAPAVDDFFAQQEQRQQQNE